MTPAQAIPTCRLFALEALKEAETKAYAAKRAKKSTAQPAQTTKEVNLSWNVTDHDLEHKLDSGLQALKKGNKVDVMIGVKRKRGTVLPSVQQRSSLVVKVKQQLAEHGKERKAPEGSVDAGYVLRYLGNGPTASQSQ
jgi:translation initiation factor IF-3